MKHSKAVSDNLGSRIQNLRDYVERNYGGHGGGGTTVNSVFNEVVAGSGTTFTLANVPIINTQAIFALGQRLVPTVDYTIAGAVITTVSSWNATDIIADYQY